MTARSPRNMAIWNGAGLLATNGTVTLSVPAFDLALDKARAQQAASDWRPVRDGVIDYRGAILTYAPPPRGESKSLGYVWQALHGGKAAPVPREVTHWMPRPPPPKEIP